jgi:hypothetical protein
MSCLVFKCVLMHFGSTLFDKSSLLLKNGQKFSPTGTLQDGDQKNVETQKIKVA